MTCDGIVQAEFPQADYKGSDLGGLVFQTLLFHTGCYI